MLISQLVARLSWF